MLEIVTIKPFLSFHDVEKAIPACITSQLDYCNSLYLDAPQFSLTRRHMVQNAAARILNSTDNSEHITPVLASLHWLPVHFRIQFKTLLIAFKALNGQPTSYITHLIHWHSASGSFRSDNKSLLYVPWSRLSIKGDRAFAVAAL